MFGKSHLKALNANLFFVIISFGVVQFDMNEEYWLRMSSWNNTKENIILVHGYASGDDVLPMSVLRDAYLNNGNYNVFVIDWSALSLPPCQ